MLDDLLSSWSFLKYLLKRYGPNLQNDTKLETTSFFIAEKMALDKRSFFTGSLRGSLLVNGGVISTSF